MIDVITRVLQGDPRISYALVFGSQARGAARADSDVDVALGLREPMTVSELGDLISRLEQAVGHEVDLVLLDEAPPGLAYRVFRDGATVVVRDHDALVRRRARATLEYLDFQPFEELFTRGVLAAATRGR